MKHPRATKLLVNIEEVTSPLKIFLRNPKGADYFVISLEFASQTSTHLIKPRSFGSLPRTATKLSVLPLKLIHIVQFSRFIALQTSSEEPGVSLREAPEGQKNLQN